MHGEVLLLSLILELAQVGGIFGLLLLEGAFGLLEGLPLLYILWLFVSILRELTLQGSLLDLEFLLVLGAPLLLFLLKHVFTLLVAFLLCFETLLTRVECGLQLLKRLLLHLNVLSLLVVLKQSLYLHLEGLLLFFGFLEFALHGFELGDEALLLLGDCVPAVLGLLLAALEVFLHLGHFLLKLALLFLAFALDTLFFFLQRFYLNSSLLKLLLLEVDLNLLGFDLAAHFSYRLPFSIDLLIQLLDLALC